MIDITTILINNEKLIDTEEKHVSYGLKFYWIKYHSALLKERHN
jgi:hypothetical protein